MAKAKEKLTRASLLKAIDEKLQAVNLLRAALNADPSRKQEDLENYHRQFVDIFNLDKSKK
jgi:hypothetical protein